MRLIALLSYYNESPTWLAAHIASLTRIGTTHLIAHDGRYPHFPENPTNSPHDQTATILETAQGAGLTVNIITADQPMSEVDKRHRMLEYANIIATPYDDWLTIFDADERIVTDNPTLKAELATLPETAETIPVMLTDIEDVESTPANAKAHRTLNIPSAYSSRRFRIYRMLNNMQAQHVHWNITGTRRNGTVVSMQNDTASKTLGIPFANPHTLETPIEAIHLKHSRPARRRSNKDHYYKTRDELGVEALPKATR